ncbi:hypothetical protein VTK26DRAFT_4069 [Humicola hyalothermophila]
MLSSWARRRMLRIPTVLLLHCRKAKLGEKIGNSLIKEGSELISAVSLGVDTERATRSPVGGRVDRHHPYHDFHNPPISKTRPSCSVCSTPFRSSTDRPHVVISHTRPSHCSGRHIRRQNAAPSPFLLCRLLKRLRFTLTLDSSRLAWLLLNWLRPDRSLMLYPPAPPPSEKLLAAVAAAPRPPPIVLAGLDMDDDMSPNPLSPPYEPIRFCDMARSLARSSDSIQSSIEDLAPPSFCDDLGSSKT